MPTYSRGSDAFLIAAHQARDIQGDRADALRVVVQVAADAARQGARLVCFPEGFLTGYTRDGAVAEHRAMSFSSPAFVSVRRQLSAIPATVVLGVIERDGANLFNTAAVIDRGRLVGRYRKRHLVEQCFTAGRSLPTFTTGPLTFGLGICSDARCADDAGRLASSGVDVILYPLNNMLPHASADRWRSRHAEILRDRARQTHTWIVSADVVGEPQTHRSYGCTLAIDPAGVCG